MNIWRFFVRSIASRTLRVVILVTLLSLTATLLVFGYLFLGYRLALRQWTSNGYDTRKPVDRNELDARLYLAKKTRGHSFRDLAVGRMYKWNAEAGIYEGWKNNNYRPSSADSYVSYKILGVAPIDVVFDADDHVVLAFPSFDH